MTDTTITQHATFVKSATIWGTWARLHVEYFREALRTGNEWEAEHQAARAVNCAIYAGTCARRAWEIGGAR